MHFQFIVAPPTPALTPPAPPAAETSADLLRQLLDVQREQLGVITTAAASQNEGNAARWRNFFSRWHEDYPHLPSSLSEALPSVERAFLRLMDEMARYLKDEETAGLDDDFTLGEFLDRFAIRAGQIGSILNLLGQMTEACRGESGGKGPMTSPD
jgi:hypothetical protein